MPRYPQPGEVLLGKYRVESLIGEGGMGAVLKAHHLDLDEPVAIKCLLPEMMDRKDIVSRFVREGKAAAKLKGEHVARVMDVGRLANEIPYIVMEYLDGADLGAIIKHHGAQDPAIAVDLILQACEAMAEAHAIGVIHRDIKASNFFIVQPPGQAPTLKVLDFGIATAPEGTSDLTGTQSVIGTPAYMAPEQMRAAMKADARSDIWSMGVVLYELLEAERPFRSEVYSELVLKVGMDPPHAMANPAVPGALQAIVMKCLEKPMERRYQTIAELAYDLMPFASDAVQARAIVEQCARLLGRRSTKGMSAVMPVTDPDSGPVPRLTPRSAQMAVAPPPDVSRPISSSQPELPPTPTLLGRPTPVPGSTPRTPTSVNSRGEVGKAASPMPTYRPRRRALWIGLTALVCIAAGGGALYYTTLRDPGTTAAASAPRPAPPPPPTLDYKPTRLDDTEPAQPPEPPKQKPADIAKPGEDKHAPTIGEVKTSPEPKVVKKVVKTPRPPTPNAGSGSGSATVEVGGDLYKKRQ